VDEPLSRDKTGARVVCLFFVGKRTSYFIFRRKNHEEKYNEKSAGVIAGNNDAV